jgi:hypothetical protein
MERRSEDLSARQPVGDRQTGTRYRTGRVLSKQCFRSVRDPDLWIRHLENKDPDLGLVLVVVGYPFTMCWSK